jgi:putative membrane protein
VTKLLFMSERPKIDRIREHQANERTFLAWLRTSISLVGFGLALARFSLFLRQLQGTITNNKFPERNPIGYENLGVVLVILGILMIVLAAWRYNQVFQQIEREDYQPNRLIVWLIAAIVTILGILSIPLVLYRNQEPGDPSSTSGQRQSQKLTYRSVKQRNQLRS